MRYAGKTKSRMTKKGLFSGRKPSFKKAIVTLKEGQVIDFFQNI
jgi:large subunit ribosomal protein L23